MKNYYLAPITHIIPLTTIRRVRRLPRPGRITVRLNQKVQPPDVVAEAETILSYIFLDIAHGLGVSPNSAEKYIARGKGSEVEEGEVIAGPIGFSRRTVRAPGDGRVVEISDGKVLFELHSEPFRMRAGFSGVVVDSDGLQQVSIETVGALIQAAWGNGQQDCGVMRLVSRKPGDRLIAEQLDINLRGAVLVAGICDSEEPLHRAADLSIRGLILGGMAADLMSVAQRQSYPIVIIEGFGDQPINSAAYDLLSSNIGREAALDARPTAPYKSHRPEIVIPLPASIKTSTPEDFVMLEKGTRVQVLRLPHRGAVGIVDEVLAQAVHYPSGIRARSARINIGEAGIITVPLANLKTLQ